MRIAYVQMNCEFGKVKNNTGKAVNLLHTHDADLFVLPELFTSGYIFTNFTELLNLSEEIPDGPTCKLLTELCSEKNCLIVAGIPETYEGNYYNSAVLVGSQGVLLQYRKTHLFCDEKKWFKPGDTGFNVKEINGVRFGIMICFDWIFPESARTLALKGADIICHPANLVLPYCQKAMITRSLENGIFSITANRIGTEKRGSMELTFTGASQILDIKGNVLHQAGVIEEGVGIVEVNPLQARNKDVTTHNNLMGDRRTEWYNLGT